MSVDELDLTAFLQGFGFSCEEIASVHFETDQFRAIPGTSLRRYMNRIIETIDEDDRTAFLKGIILGVAIREAVLITAGVEPDGGAGVGSGVNLADVDAEVRRIDLELLRLRAGVETSGSRSGKI